MFALFSASELYESRILLFSSNIYMFYSRCNRVVWCLLCSALNDLRKHQMAAFSSLQRVYKSKYSLRSSLWPSNLWNPSFLWTYSIASWLVSSTSNTKRTSPCSAAFSVVDYQISGTLLSYKNMYIYFKITLEGFHVRSVLSFSKDLSLCWWLVSLLDPKRRDQHRMFCFFLCLWTSNIRNNSILHKYIYLLWTLSAMDLKMMHANRMFALFWASQDTSPSFHGWLSLLSPD